MTTGARTVASSKLHSPLDDLALVAGSETTLKRFYRESADTIRLQPANTTLRPIIVPAKDVQIQGRLLAVLRKYK